MADKEDKTSISSTTRWVVGVILGILSSVSGYMLNTVIDVESRLAVLEDNSGLSPIDAARIATLEEEMKAAKRQLKNIWEKYNAEQDDKTDWIKEYGELMSRILLLEYEIKELKK